MDLNLRDLRAFVAVAQTGSFTRAASKLNLSQPALTVQIRRLEETVGARLFDRNSRTVALTSVGRELLPVLQKSLADMQRVLDDARALGDGSRGTVRIACLPSFAAGRLPALIRDFHGQAPHTRFEIRDVVASTVNQLVRAGEFDLGVTGGAVDDPQIDILHRAQDRLMVVCPRDHPLARKRRVGAADLAADPLVLTAPGTSVRAIVDSAFGEAGCVSELACEPTYMMTAVAMVQAGLGITILPGATPEIRAERELIGRPIDDARFVRAVLLIKKRGRTLPPATLAFADTLKGALEVTSRA
ncbi:MAG TPA: LysR family transcriptional regulator [Trinickia sp.]|uniref:LysR family transcriptional regulator n=1 Tax=Trinickia sp. TaxID=2571163 RepID=UPI002C3544E3|nr:LysR family transcriptional regulator [Trinickia sp.]HVW52391.1 LysR family transcriptional regulator [Trinickia sp.]